LTYSNSCFAAKAGVSIGYDGECSCYSSYQTAISGTAVCWGLNRSSEIVNLDMNKTIGIGGGAIFKGMIVSNGAVEVNGVTLR
jgi:hypothetical protein